MITILDSRLSGPGLCISWGHGVVLLGMALPVSTQIFKLVLEFYLLAKSTGGTWNGLGFRIVEVAGSRSLLE